MIVSRSRLTGIVVAAILAGGALGGVAVAYQGHMLAARHALFRAKAELQASAHNKAGHRIAALRAVDAAIRQVDIGMRYGR